MTRFFAALITLVLLAACAAPTALQTGRPATPAPRLPRLTVARQAAKPTPAPLANIQGAHSYEGDTDNSITVGVGDVFTIHNPDFSRGYTFRIVAISAMGITVATDEPNITIRDNGGKMPYFIHTTESYKTGYELPIGWARFTPLEKTPVVQTYSMQPGGFIVRNQDDG